MGFSQPGKGVRGGGLKPLAGLADGTKVLLTGVLAGGRIIGEVKEAPDLALQEAGVLTV